MINLIRIFGPPSPEGLLLFSMELPMTIKEAVRLDAIKERIVRVRPLNCIEPSACIEVSTHNKHLLSQEKGEVVEDGGEIRENMFLHDLCVNTDSDNAETLLELDDACSHPPRVPLNSDLANREVAGIDCGTPVT
jgi:hypothetical protein